MTSGYAFIGELWPSYAAPDEIADDDGGQLPAHGEDVTMFCVRCGRQLPDDDPDYNFCPKCGKALVEGNEEAGAAGARRLRLREVDVQRINVVEPDGTLRLVISAKASFPDEVVMRGEVLGKRSGPTPAGVIFYNDEGNECGGLMFVAKRQNGQYGAESGLFLDQFEQDQVVGLSYGEENGQRESGLRIWDRPEMPLDRSAERFRAVEGLPEGPEKTAALQQLRSEGLMGSTRVFVGRSRDGDAVLNLCDSDGRSRLRLVVGREGSPRLEFLDEYGQVTSSWPGMPPEGVR